MLSLRTSIFLFAAIVVVVSFPSEKYNIDDILSNIPADERPEFLKYHIKEGYNLSQDNGSKTKMEPQLPEDFSLYIYNLAMRTSRITDEKILKQLREIICFEDGTCVDVGDIGVHP